MRKLNQRLQSVSRGLYKGFFVFATLTFAALLTLLLINVFSRNMLDGSIAWIEEGSRFLFTWMMFLGISIGVYHKKHLGVEFLVAKYPPKIRRVVKFINNLLMCLLFLVLTIFGLKYSFSTMRMLSPIMEVPYGAVYLCVPLCGLFSLFYCVARMVGDLCRDDGENGGEQE